MTCCLTVYNAPGSQSHGGVIPRGSPLSHLGPVHRLVLEAALVAAVLRRGAVAELGLGRRRGRRHLGRFLGLGQSRRRLLLPGDIGERRVVSDGLQLRDGGQRGRVAIMCVAIGQTPGRGGANLQIMSLVQVQRLD